MIETLLRETAFGQIARLVTGNRLFPYPEERPDFQIPQHWLDIINDDTPATGEKSSPNESTETDADMTAVGSSSSSSSASSINEGDNDEETGEKKKSAKADDDEEKKADAEPYASGSNNASRRGSSSLGLQRTKSRADTIPFTEARLEADQLHEIEKLKSTPIVPKKTADGAILVDWYFSDDPENPQNWSNLRRGMVTTIICAYTFVVYTSSAIYTSSIEGVIHRFGVDLTEAQLGLALFVLGYGLGPLLFSPLSEIPRLGRNSIYIITMFLFVIVSIPAAVVQNYPGLMVLRFLQGFFGSPCLASGAATMGDMYSLLNLPYALIAWVSAAYCGPALGPLLSGFSVPVKGWRWSLYEILWAASPVFIVMFLFLPETSQPNILLRRAQRLRKLTGNQRFMSQSEIDQREMRFSAVVIDALIKPFQITFLDPAIAFVNFYSALIYGIYYSFFEVFPLVYPVYYHMNLGQIGLVFLCILVSCLVGVAIYMSYLYFYLNPRIIAKGFPVQEFRLIPAIPASFGPTIGLFLFAWTARESIHWIASVVGISIYGATVFVVMQCIFVYVPLSYPQYAASLFAANDFFRSALAFASILYAHPMYEAMGVAHGTSLLGGLSVTGIIGIVLLYVFGARLRAMSRFAYSGE